MIFGVSAPPLYPVFFRLDGRPVVIAGGGRASLRKARALVRAGAVVTVVAPAFARGFERLPVGRVEDRWRPAHLRGAVLAFAATGDAGADEAVAKAGRAKGIPVCLVSDGAGGDFHVPAVARRGRVSIAVSTAGASPALARLLRDEVRALLGNGLAKAADSLADLRRELRRSGLAPARRRALLRSLGGPGLARRIRAHGAGAAVRALRSAVRKAR
jgi:siroheme synthase-like protein